MSSIQAKLTELGIKIPSIPKPTAAYVPGRIVGNLVFVSGQTPTVDGKLMYRGKVGRDLTVEQGYDAARLAALNCLAELEMVLGSLDYVKSIVKVNGYVSSEENFNDQPKVVNGASELLESVFGEAGSHSRIALGTNELPGGAPVEIELIAEIET